MVGRLTTPGPATESSVAESMAQPVPARDYWAGRRTPEHEEYRQARDLLLRLRTDHDAAVTQFRWPRPSTFNWALEWFDVLAAEPDTADRPALVLWDGEQPREITFAEMSRRSDEVAVWLGSVGVRRGDRLLVVLHSQPELWQVMLAALKLGAVSVPAYPQLTTDELADRVRRGRIDHVVAADDLSADYDAEIQPPVTKIAVPGSNAPDGWISWTGSLGACGPFFPDRATGAGDLAFGYFTSGTTSQPKLVGHTHASYPIGHLSSLYWNGLLPGDRHYNAAGPGWAKHSWSSFFVPWTAGATVVSVLGDQPDPATLPALLERAGVSTFCAPPSTWRAMLPVLSTGRPRLREATCAGEALTPDAAVAVRTIWDVEVRDGYGQTECTAVVGTTPGLTPRPGLVGKALPGYAARIEDGELVVPLDPRPVGLMAGYLSDGERTAAAFGGAFYRTGDCAEIDDEGWFKIEGRTDDVFKSFDRRLSPHELEVTLRSHPKVRDVAVLGAPHAVGGAVPHAVVIAVAGSDLTTDELSLYLGTRMPGVSLASTEFVEDLPYTASGKLQRGRLRRERWPGPTGKTVAFDD